jgi:hypothetical protein
MTHLQCDSPVGASRSHLRSKQQCSRIRTCPFCAIPTTSKGEVKFVAVTFYDERVVVGSHDSWDVDAEILFADELRAGMQQLGIYLAQSVEKRFRPTELEDGGDFAEGPQERSE